MPSPATSQAMPTLIRSRPPRKQPRHLPNSSGFYRTKYAIVLRVDLLEALEKFSTGNEVEAKRAWAVIEPHLLAFMGRYLSTKLTKNEEREDVISETTLRI